MANWETVYLGDICVIERGGSPRPISEFITNDENGVNWVKITDATASGKCIYSTEEKIIPEGVKRSRMVHPGDFILSNSMSFGRPYIMQTTGCIHDGWLALRNPKADTDFLYFILSSEVVSNQFESLAAGSTVRNLNVEIAKKVKIPLPPLAEQRKIAEILRTWDEAIETAEAELKAKQDRKRWLMDKLFKFSPESHLEQVKMQDAVDVQKGEQINRHTLAEKGSYPVWNGGITPSGYTESCNTEGPALIMSEGGNSCGAITRVNENFWRGGHCYHVVPRNGFSNDYLYAALKYYEPQIMRLRVGSGLPNIQKKTFLSWSAPLHKPEYRDKVASVFSHAQYEDELLRNQIETLRSQKRGLMQKILTGEIAVK
jgi:type I restriction enzyme S subunit